MHTQIPENKRSLAEYYMYYATQPEREGGGGGENSKEEMNPTLQETFQAQQLFVAKLSQFSSPLVLTAN